VETIDSIKEPAKPVPAKEQSGGWGGLVRFLLILFILAVSIRSFVVAPFSIPSGSMLPRMMIGDYLFVSKWSYGYSRYSFPFGIASFDGRLFEGLPERGDVAVFRYPGNEGEDFVKRVIGLPGDQVQMRGGILHLNGEPVARTRIADFLMPLSPNSPCRFVDEAAGRTVEQDGRRYCAYPRYRERLPGGRSYEILDQGATGADDTDVFLVPQGHVFVMGDNRDDSLDSRFPQQMGGVGFLPIENLLGRAFITFFSTDGSAEWVKPWTWASAARWDRIGGSY
jgi:signal peptidase I